VKEGKDSSSPTGASDDRATFQCLGRIQTPWSNPKVNWTLTKPNGNVVGIVEYRDNKSKPE